MEAVRMSGPFLSRLRAGDEAAFEDLVRAYAGRLHSVARRVLRDPEEARDAVQDAFLSVVRSIDGFVEGAPLSPWLHRIAVNASISRLRSRRRLVRVPEGREAAGPPAWPEAALHAREARDVVRRCLAALSARDRAVVSLRDLRGHDTLGTARILGITPNAVKIRLHRARRRMRALLLAGRDGPTAISHGTITRSPRREVASCPRIPLRGS